MGPPGAFRQENANALKDNFSWEVIHTGDLLKQQAEKKQTDPIGKQIQESFKSYKYGKFYFHHITVRSLQALFFSGRLNRH